MRKPRVNLRQQQRARTARYRANLAAQGRVALLVYVKAQTRDRLKGMVSRDCPNVASVVEQLVDLVEVTPSVTL